MGACLEVASLWPAISLDMPAGGSDASLSSGQRQLLTFGRTTLQQSRVVVMDEPTASVDMQTDQVIQAAARKVFRDCTVITIAHRIDTIRDYDRWAIIDAGKLVELGAPAV